MEGPGTYPYIDFSLCLCLSLSLPPPIAIPKVQLCYSRMASCTYHDLSILSIHVRVFEGEHIYPQLLLPRVGLEDNLLQKGQSSGLCILMGMQLG